MFNKFLKSEDGFIGALLIFLIFGFFFALATGRVNFAN